MHSCVFANPFLLQSWEKAMEYSLQFDEGGGCKTCSKNDYYRLAKYIIFRGHVRNDFDKPLVEMDHRGVFIYPHDRILLRRTLNRRCEKMLADGLLVEAYKYMNEYKTSKIPIIGYREAVEFIQLENPTIRDFHQFLFAFQHATMTYAKRQMTWFRNSERLNKTFRVVPSGMFEEFNDVMANLLLELYHQTPEEYEKDDRFRAPLPTATKAETNLLKEYHVEFEVFDKPENVKFLLQTLQREKAILEAQKNTLRRT